MATPFCVPKRGIGSKARYVRLFKPATTNQGFFLSQVVVTDSTGRNVALNKDVRVNAPAPLSLINPPYPASNLVNGQYQSSDTNYFYPDGNYSPPNGWNYTGELYIDIDLGDEYWIVDITLHISKFAFNYHKTWASGIQVEMRDTYQNKVGPQFTTNERIYDYTMLMRTEQYIRKYGCPNGTTEINNICYKSCPVGKTEINGRCYDACPTAQWHNESELSTTDSTKCISCPDYHKFRNNKTQCLVQCAFNPNIYNGFLSDIDDTVCKSNCLRDEENIQMYPTNATHSYDFNGNFCSTQAYYRDWYLLYKVMYGSEHRFNAWGYWNNYGTNGSGELSVDIFKYAQYKALDATVQGSTNKTMMRRVYRTDRTVYQKSPIGVTITDRPSQGKEAVDKIAIDTIPQGYDTVTVTISGASFEQYFKSYFDWTSTDASLDFRRHATGKGYIVGRFFAQTFSYSGLASSTIVVPVSPPVPTSFSCPQGYTYDASNPSLPCKGNKPNSSWEEIGNKYYGPCDTNFSIDPNNNTVCILDCAARYGSTYKSSTNNMICIDNCSNNFIREGNSCRLDCSRISDSNNKQTVVHSNGLCITAPPSGTNIKKARFPYGPTYIYTWIDTALSLWGSALDCNPCGSMKETGTSEWEYQYTLSKIANATEYYQQFILDKFREIKYISRLEQATTDYPKETRNRQNRDIQRVPILS